jgi:hypothetical protein
MNITEIFDWEEEDGGHGKDYDQYTPTEQLEAVTQYGGIVCMFQHPTKEAVKVALVEPKWISSDDETYEEFVEEYFKNNTILMNKWLRYAQNIRDLG